MFSGRLHKVRKPAAQQRCVYERSKTVKQLSGAKTKNKFLSLAIVGVASMGLSLASPAVSQAWVYAPGRQMQPSNAAPSYLNNYGYSGSFGYGGYGYNSFGYPGYGYNYGGYGYPGFGGFNYGYSSYGYPGYYNGFANPFYNAAPYQFGFGSPFGYRY